MMVVVVTTRRAGRADSVNGAADILIGNSALNYGSNGPVRINRRGRLKVTVRWVALRALGTTPDFVAVFRVIS